ncbi:MAG: hypothetical protein U0359_37775 [Byssovorax sp.]
MRVLSGLERSLASALGLGRPLLARAAREGEVWMAASLVPGPAVVLGAAQRAGRVVRLTAGTDVYRRTTSGTTVYIGQRALIWTLALPHVAALVADATPRTLLNRNVRGFLAGLGRAGAAAHYFGREWISVRKQPAAVLGFETTREGAVLIEVLAGVDASPALPEALAADEERAVDRWLGKAPAALGALLPEEPAVIAREVVRAVALRAGAAMDEGEAIEVEAVFPVEREDDPMPEGFARGPSHRVPIGWIDTGSEAESGRSWLGGDVLVPSWAIAAIAAGQEPGEVPIEGAAPADLRAALRRG